MDICLTVLLYARFPFELNKKNIAFVNRTMTKKRRKRRRKMKMTVAWVRRERRATREVAAERATRRMRATSRR